MVVWQGFKIVNQVYFADVLVEMSTMPGAVQWEERHGTLERLSSK